MSQHKKTPALFVSTYDATEHFRSIATHVALCFEDGGLVGVVGEMGDKESQETAESIARAVNEYDEDKATIKALLDAAEDAVGLIRGNYPMASSVSLLHKLEKAIAEAEKNP